MCSVYTPVHWQLASIIQSLPASARICHHKRTSPDTTTMTHAVTNTQHVLINGFHPQISNTTNKMLPKVSMVYGSPRLGSRLCSNFQSRCFAHTPKTDNCRPHRLSQQAPGRCHRQMNTMQQLHTYKRVLDTSAADATFLNPLNAELNPTCQLLALLGAHHILHISRIRVNTRH